MEGKKLSEKVLEKKFEVSTLGYNCRQVDSYLDELNEEICKLERKVKELINENEALDAQIKSLKQQNKNLYVTTAELKAKTGQAITNPDDFLNVQVLKRLTNLENMVFELIESQKNK